MPSSVDWKVSQSAGTPDRVTALTSQRDQTDKSDAEGAELSLATTLVNNATIVCHFRFSGRPNGTSSLSAFASCVATKEIQTAGANRIFHRSWPHSIRIRIGEPDL